MLQGTRQASVPSTAGTRPNTGNSAAILQSDQPPRDAAAREGGRGGTGAESLVRGAVVASCVSCGICGGLLRDATAFPECLHAFCRKCIYDKVAKDNIRCCPKCGIFLGNPLDKLRSLIFPAKRRKVVAMKKRKERVSSESTLSSVVGISAEGSKALTPAASESKAQKDLALVDRDASSRIKGRDFDSACGLTEETGALIVWQASPILEEMVAHNQLDSKQDSESFRLSSDIENQRQEPAAKMTNISVMIESSSCARPTVQDDENLRGDFLTLINESNARIMGRYDAHISKLKAENTKLIEELENGRERTRILEERLQRELKNERTAAAERTRLLEKKLQRELEHEREAAIERTIILDESLQRELENERAAASERIRLLENKLQRELEHEREAAIERTRVLDKRLQRESEIGQTTASRNEALEKKITELHEELEHGRADKQALMSDILEKSEELATLKYYSNVLESEKTYLENQVDHLNEELKNTRKKHTIYVHKVLDAARAIPYDLEPINSDALPRPRRTVRNPPEILRVGPIKGRGLDLGQEKATNGLVSRPRCKATLHKRNIFSMEKGVKEPDKRIIFSMEKGVKEPDGETAASSRSRRASARG